MRPLLKTAACAAWLCAISHACPATGRAQSGRLPARLELDRPATQPPPQSPLADSLEVEPGATCVGAGSLAPQIEAWLGSTALDPALSVRVHGAADDPRDVAFEIRDGDEILATRRFAPAPFVCAQLEATLALAIAMALKASLRDELLDDLGGEVTDTPPPPSEVDTLSVQVRAGAGLLPRRSFGGGVAFMRALGDRFGLRTALGVDGARRIRLEGQPGSFDTWLLSAQIEGCALLPITEGWEARACFGCALGAMRTNGRGYEEARSDWLAWVALVNGLALSARLSGPWWLDVPLSVAVPLNEVGFAVVDASGATASSLSLPVVGLTVGVATQVRF